LYKQLSENAAYADIIFRKCNVDTAADVAKLCKIQSMPTFKVFKNGKEFESLTGWNESKLKKAIDAARK
jgi:thioredoxin-like negative regulator of GroEL